MTVRGLADQRLLADLESLLGKRPDKRNRAVRWSDLEALRKQLISAGGAGGMDGVPPEGSGPDAGLPAIPGTIGERLIARLRQAEEEIDAAEAEAQAAQDTALNALSALERAGTIYRAANIVTLPDGSRTAGIEAFVWDDEGNGTGSALLLHGEQVIAPGTMYVNALVAGFGNNLAQNSRFYDSALHWQFITGAQTTGGVRQAGQAYAHPSYRTLELFQDGTAAEEATIIYSPDQEVGAPRIPGAPCEPGKWYGASGHLSAQRCIGRVQVRFLDANGALIPTAGASSLAATATGSAVNPDTWPRLFAKAQAPAGAVYVTFGAMKGGTIAGNPNSRLVLWKPQIEETHAAATVPAPYSSGDVSMITGDGIYGRTLRGRHLVSNEAIITGLTQMGAATVGNAQITGAISSDDFVTGENGQGWRINKAGTAEFNNIIIRRQIEVASGTVNIGSFVPTSLYPKYKPATQNEPEGVILPSGAAVNLSNGPGGIFEVLTTPIAITEWQGARATYIATVGMTGTVSSPDSANCYWGWTADVMPLTKWSGNQSLRLRLLFWSKQVSEVQNCVVTWKIYKVS